MNYSYGQIILSSERLFFRQHELSDRDAFCDMEMDPEVRRYVGGYPRTREDAEARFMNGAMKPVTDRMGMWATVLKENHSYIGRCGIYPHFKPDGGVFEREASLGLYIARDYWGNGFATEAGLAFIQFGFNELDLNRIVTSVQIGNNASVRVLERLGFLLASTENGKRSFYHFIMDKPAAI